MIKMCINISILKLVTTSGSNTFDKLKTSQPYTCVVVSWWFWCIHIHTFWAIQFHHSLTGYIWKSNWKHWLVFTIDSWTMSEVSRLILFYHLQNKMKIRSICVQFSYYQFLEIPSPIYLTHLDTHLCYSTICEYVSCMYKTVQHFCCLLDEIRLIRIIFKVIIRLQV